MKKLAVIIYILCISCSQNKNVTQNSQQLSDSVNTPKAVFPIPNSVYKKYMNFRDSAQIAYKQKDYKKCAYFFEKANEQVYLNDGYLKFIGGVSFYNIAIESKDEKTKEKAKLLLIQANHEGYSEALTFIKKNF